MTSKVIALRIDERKFLALQNKAGEKGFRKVSEFLQEIINNMIENNIDVQKEKKQQYPSDARCRKLYKIFIEETKGNGGKIPKSKSKTLQLRAAIVQSRTFRTRIEMLKAQGYLTEQKLYFVVLKRWK